MLDENDRSAVTHALASRDTRTTFWTTLAGSTYALARSATGFDDACVREFGGTLDEPQVIVLRVRPVVEARVATLEGVLGGPGRPAGVIAARAAAGEIAVELQPHGRALVLLLALIDAVLAATPGRTIVPVLPLSDGVLAEYAALRLGDPELTASRVLDPYVEELLAVSGT